MNIYLSCFRNEKFAIIHDNSYIVTTQGGNKLSILDSKQYKEAERQSWNNVAAWLAKVVEDNRKRCRKS